MWQTLHEALALVKAHTGLKQDDEALVALQLVTSALVARLSATEAKGLILQLPEALQEPLLELRAGPDRRVSLPGIRDTLAERLAIEPAAASALLPRVGAALRALVSPGEIQDLLAQLPHELQGIFGAAPRLS